MRLFEISAPNLLHCAAKGIEARRQIPLYPAKAQRPPRDGAACHTDTYAGTSAVARLAGQREDYLLKALHDYKSGARSGGSMAAMAEVAYPLSEEEITALAHYLANL